MKIVFEEADLQAILARELRYQYPNSEITVMYTDNGVVVDLREKEVDDVVA